MGGTSREEERETRWEHNKKLRKKSAVPGAVVSVREIDRSIMDFFDQHWQPGWKQARSRVRGTAFVRELLRLALEWNDKRFVEAIKAMIEYQIVTKRCGFTGRRAPGYADRERQISARRQQQDDEQIERVRLLLDQGMSHREACKKVAEDAGRPGHSFSAAHEQLRKISARALKKRKGG
jgi:uncharacterized protein YoaH (UPF0181 family)